MPVDIRTARRFTSRRDTVLWWIFARAGVFPGDRQFGASHPQGAITRDNLRAVLELSVADDQLEAYPRSNAYSIAEAHYPPDDDTVWLRAIYAGQTPVGLILTSEAEDEGEYFLWRLMVDHRFQSRGYGRRAVELLVERILRTDNAKALTTSHLQADADAGRFYQRLGFEYTGKRIGAHDLELRLTFE